MAGNDKNSFFGERNMTPSRQQQYSPSFNLDNGRHGLRPPPGLSPVPHFPQGNSFMGIGAGGMGLGNHQQQQSSYPLMTKSTNGGNYYNMVPPPGYAYFTPPQSPHFMNSHSPSPGPNFDHQYHQNFHQGFGQAQMYNFGANDGYTNFYESGAAVPDFALKDSFRAASEHHVESVPMSTTHETDSSRVIEPIIENIVGTSSGGTYTHFGPAPAPAKSNGMSPSLGGGIITGNAHLKNIDLNGKWQDSPFLQNDHGKAVGRLSNGDNSKAAVQRPVTPISPALSAKSKNTAPAQTKEASKTPQTSAKPSYLEILTKSTKNLDSEKKSSAKKYTTASEVRPSRGSPTIQSTSSNPFVQIHNQVHRKLSDGFVGGSTAYSGSGDGASNSSTASSSPVVKPKQNQNLFLKGKENSFSQQNMNTKGSPAKSANNNNNSPAFYDTPTKNKANEWTKKVGNGKKNHGGKFSGKNINQGGVLNDGISPISTFDFDIEDLDDEIASTEIDNQLDEKSAKKKLSSAEKSKKSHGSIGNGFSNNSISGKANESKGQTNSGSKKGRDKAEKSRSRKEGRNCTIRRVQIVSAIWLGHLCAALNWLWALLLSVTTLSVSLGYTLCEDAFNWWKTQAVPKFAVNFRYVKDELSKIKSKMKPSRLNFWSTKEPTQQPKPETPRDLAELLAMLGPERNIVLPASGEEALQRLLSVKGKDPYSILGVRSDSSDDTIRRYYKKQAVLVHPDKNLVPGAEEAFKILARAFELVGEPIKRSEYHHQFLEAHAKEQFFGEFGNLFEQLRKKMESVSTTIKCTKCNARHKKNRTDRPVFAARYCAQCRIHHAAREGELWAEKKGMFGFWQYYTCMDNIIWEMNEWGKCQRKSLKHLVPDSHGVIYRLVSGTQTGQSRNGTAANGSGAPVDEDLLDPEMDDWDSLIHNLCRASSATSNGTATTHPKGGTRNMMNGHGTPGTATTGSVNSGFYSSSASSVKKRKGKRK